MEGQARELLSLLPEELEEWMLSVGEPKYRAKQIFPQLHKGLSPDEMTNLGKRLQATLREHFSWHLPVVERMRALFSLANGADLATPVLRATGIALIAELTASLCRDLGEGSVADVVLLFGKLEILVLCLPLIDDVLEIAKELLKF